MSIYQFDITKNPKTFAYVLEKSTVNLRHNICDSIVLVNTNGKSEYQCLHCDEDIDVKDIYSGKFQNTEEFDKLLVIARDLLLLDH